MAQDKGDIRHLLVVKFKDGVTEERIQEFAKEYADLANLISPIKSFIWGKDVSIPDNNDGYTHVFELTFASLGDVSKYKAHPSYALNDLPPDFEKAVVIDYYPVEIPLSTN